MGSYLVAYEYSYSEKKSKFTTVVEAESFKDAEHVFKDHNQSATILDIKLLDPCKKEYRGPYPAIIDVRFVVKDDTDIKLLEETIAEATGYNIGLDPFGMEECFTVMSVEHEHGKKCLRG